MKKMIFYSQLLLSINAGLFFYPKAFAKENNCAVLTREIVQLEKDLVHKNHLLAKQKQELEKLPPEASSAKMKITADSIVTAAESETIQNWIEVKKKEKRKSCGK